MTASPQLILQGSRTFDTSQWVYWIPGGNSKSRIAIVYIAPLSAFHLIIGLLSIFSVGTMSPSIIFL